MLIYIVILNLSIPKSASASRGRSSKDFWLISASFRRYRGMQPNGSLAATIISAARGGSFTFRQQVSPRKDYPMSLVALLGFSAARRLQGRRFKPQIEPEQFGQPSPSGGAFMGSDARLLPRKSHSTNSGNRQCDENQAAYEIAPDVIERRPARSRRPGAGRSSSTSRRKRTRRAGRPPVVALI